MSKTLNPFLVFVADFVGQGALNKDPTVWLDGASVLKLLKDIDLKKQRLTVT